MRDFLEFACVLKNVHENKMKNRTKNDKHVRKWLFVSTDVNEL